MRKIEKLALSKKDIIPTDILKKKQMGILWGGRFCCTWACTIDANGTQDDGNDGGSSYEECETRAERVCYPASEYGYIIINNC